MSLRTDDPHEVTWDDQNNINSFSKLNWKLTKLEEQLEEKKEELSYVTDSVNEVELCFEEDQVLCKVGDIFVSMKLDKVSTHLSNVHEQLLEQVRGIEEQCNTVKSELSRLKVLLYGKFKDSIHLEAE